MGIIRLVGVMLAVAGGVLLWSGLNARESLAERASHALTGRYTDRTTQYLVGGGAALAGGVLLVLFGGSRKRR
ncbi:DUF3185 family protein [Myxococcus sp. K15C18031901]|uniref:DUF3185 family protein n=1 Tax=Myxococcus dinghuensis TaxID=2906761 RepID=UPI0020A83326|nr:DUF3185 family protein [Myxococcus dinghuensis]MCP3100856.1 DUF3185 family protein [Myxococcus dinghuensis]